MKKSYLTKILIVVVGVFAAGSVAAAGFSGPFIKSSFIPPGLARPNSPAKPAAMLPEWAREKICYDSDGGQAPTKAGFVSIRFAQTSTVLTQFQDKCVSNNTVLEYSCGANDGVWNPFLGYSATTMSCPSGTYCSSGACVWPM